MTIRIHPTADVSDDATIGESTSIWHHAQVREGAQLGQNCNVGKGVYIDMSVVIGNNVKIQNYVSIFHGVTIEDGVFIGPHVCFTNDLIPRAINLDGSLKAVDDWILIKTLVRRGAAVGANATIRCGITIGEWAMIGAGSVVTRDIPDHGLVWGNPAQLKGFVCHCGGHLEKKKQQDGTILARCTGCGKDIFIPQIDWERIE